MRDVQLRTVAADDATVIAAIYNHYVRETVVTFEEDEVAPADIAARMASVEQAGLPWIVAADAGRVLGYACAGPWRPRSAYRFTTETTVYLAPDATGRGIGSALYAELLARLEARGLHAAIGGIALPNAASVALHEKFGFRQAGILPEVGYKFGRWIDVGYWQRPLSPRGRT